jgi:hypothetical protein
MDSGSAKSGHVQLNMRADQRMFGKVLPLRDKIKGGGGRNMFNSTLWQLFHLHKINRDASHLFIGLNDNK